MEKLIEYVEVTLAFKGLDDTGLLKKIIGDITADGLSLNSKQNVRDHFISTSSPTHQLIEVHGHVFTETWGVVITKGLCITER